MAARHRQHTSERDRAAARRRTLASYLQALQARVEPQLLFTTLDRIRALYEIDPIRAGTGLEHLIIYLRAALPHMRESTSTVDKELTLVQSWIDIVSLVGYDAEVSIEVDDSTRAFRVPALVLLPWIQHAFMRGDKAPVRIHLAWGRSGAGS